MQNELCNRLQCLCAFEASIDQNLEVPQQTLPLSWSVVLIDVRSREIKMFRALVLTGREVISALFSYSRTALSSKNCSLILDCLWTALIFVARIEVFSSLSRSISMNCPSLLEHIFVVWNSSLFYLCSGPLVTNSNKFPGGFHGSSNAYPRPSLLHSFMVPQYPQSFSCLPEGFAGGTLFLLLCFC